MLKKALLALILIVPVALVARLWMEASKSQRMESVVGLTEGRFHDCPDRPNCVSSDVGVGEHAIAPLAGVDDAGWTRLAEQAAELPGAVVVDLSGDYLRVEVRSKLFGFVDDLELSRRSEEVAVRSASRVGHSDLGVNRSRVEALREAMTTAP